MKYILSTKSKAYVHVEAIGEGRSNVLQRITLHKIQH